MKKNQRIEFDYYITPDGERFSLHDGINKFLMSFTGMGMPPIEFLEQRGPNQHGSSILAYRLQKRVIQMVYSHTGHTRKDYWNNRGILLDMLRPNRQTVSSNLRGKLRKVIPGGVVRDIDVMIAAGPVFNARNTNQWEDSSIVSETLRFIADDPTFYDPTQVTANLIGSAETGLIFPITFPFMFDETVTRYAVNLTYTGTWLAYPIIEITGPIAGLVIENETTGKRIQIAATIGAGETITISLDFGNKQVYDDLGNNLIGLVTPDSDLASFAIVPSPLAAGGVNAISTLGVGIVDGVTAISIGYYTRYIGI